MYMLNVQVTLSQPMDDEKTNAQAMGGLLKQRQRLVCCETYVQNVTNFIARKPVKS